MRVLGVELIDRLFARAFRYAVFVLKKDAQLISQKIVAFSVTFGR